MIDIRHASERGRAEHGWLSSRHTFSFANYYDPKQIGFSDLLVINDDRVAPGRGFCKHPHRPGDVQLMSAGTGVAHSEFNHSASDSVHFLQIWIAPSVKGATPRYLQQNFSEQDKRGKLRLVLSPEGTDGSLELRQDARVYAGLFNGNETAGVDIAADRYAYVHVARGSVKLNGVELNEGDGARIRNERRLEFTEGQDAEVLVFDLRNNEVSELWS